jgi:hypothetical protein
MEALPSGREVYAELAACLSPGVASSRMRLVKRVSYPAWRTDAGASGEFLYLSLQVDGKATDPFSGGGFRVELEKSRRRVPARGLNGRALFFQLLTAGELETLVAQQNRIIAARPKPPAEQVALYPEGPVREMYLSFFEPQSEFDVIDCWLRYGSLADVRAWAEVLTPMIQPLLERADAALSPDRRDLGKGNLLGAN